MTERKICVSVGVKQYGEAVTKEGRREEVLIENNATFVWMTEKQFDAFRELVKGDDVLGLNDDELVIRREEKS